MGSLPILVIGGGVAGSACALRLRQHNLDVHVVEKATFPRAKVCGCCIGGAGLEALAQLHLRDWILDTGVITTRWLGSIGGQRVELPLAAGVSISRETLDPKLLEAALDAGASVAMGHEATITSANEHWVDVAVKSISGLQEERYAAVVVAAGLNASGLNQILPWQETPNGPFGLSFKSSIDGIETGTIYMACDEDGYVGLVRLEDGRVDVAAALHSGSASAAHGMPFERVEAMLARSEFAWTLRECTPVMTTPPLRRTRTAGNGRVLAIGDAAGYVEPFTGEGMTWGMQSGIAAADLLAESFNHLESVGKVWDRQLHGLLRSKKMTCRAVTSALRSSVARRAAAHALAAWPTLAKPLIARI